MEFIWDFNEVENFFDERSSSSLNEVSKIIAQEIAGGLLKAMKELTPVDKSGVLLNGWKGNKLLVSKKGDYFVVTIVNKAPYASAVNDGHLSYNQYGGPYQIKHRVKLTTPHKWQRGSSEWYVYGHFFVERGILQYANSGEIEEIIMNELMEWWLGD